MGKTLKYKGGVKTRPYATGPETVFDLKLLWPSLVASDKFFPNKGNLDKGFVAAGFSLRQHRRDAGATGPFVVLGGSQNHEQLRKKIEGQRRDALRFPALHGLLGQNTSCNLQADN